MMSILCYVRTVHLMKNINLFNTIYSKLIFHPLIHKGHKGVSVDRKYFLEKVECAKNIKYLLKQKSKNNLVKLIIKLSPKLKLCLVKHFFHLFHLLRLTLKSKENS